MYQGWGVGIISIRRLLFSPSLRVERERNLQKITVTQIHFSSSFYFFCFVWYIYWLCYYSCPISAPSLNSILPTPSLPHSPPYSSCPWVILVSSLASTFPTLFLPSPCLFSTYHLCYLFSVPFPPLSPSQSPIDNPPCDHHFCGSVSVLVVCLVCFCFCFRCGCL